MNENNVYFFIAINITVFSNWAMQTREQELNFVGRRSADARSIERARSLVQLYREQGLLAAEPEILVREMSQEFIAELEREGLPSRMNAVNNGRDTIWLDPHHNELPTLALDSRLGHELAHIALNQPQNSWINPHVWTYGAFTASFALRVLTLPIVVTGGFLAIPFMVTVFSDRNIVTSITRRQWRRFMVIGGIIGLSTAISRRLTSDVQEFLPNPLGYRFHCTERAEEVVCDLIAASTVPNGGQAGVELYSRMLDLNGDTNGGGSHPRTSTRNRYHKLIAQWQKIKMKWSLKR